MIPSLDLEPEDEDDEEEDDEDAEGAASTAVEEPVSSEKSNLHLGHLIAWLAMTIPQSGHFFIIYLPN